MPIAIHRGFWLICVLLLIAGCTRSHYRTRADRESYRMMADNTAGAPWEPRLGFTIFPHPASRFFDPTPIDDPMLPIPAPQLYGYKIPELPKRDPARFRPKENAGSSSGGAVSDTSQSPYHAIKTPGDLPASVTLGQPVGLEKNASKNENADLLQVGFQENKQSENKTKPNEEKIDLSKYGRGPEGQLKILPIPVDAWGEKLPPSCLKRMMEFQSIREEYEKTFSKKPGTDLRDPSQRMTFEDIMELALINSRTYQLEKEKLYRAALNLTFERFQYKMWFLPAGNGTDVDYTHLRNRGVTVNTLRINTQAAADKILVSGGELLARFANNIVLTFNGPQGFAADIGSELLFRLSQSVFQRDIVFENLTQSERALVYAARDYSRFRKTFFQDFAGQYYGLLNNYRQIEIASQNYFGNVRTFEQLKAKFRVGTENLINVGQVEQTVFSSRGSLIRTCNQLESGLDSLKVQMGIPPESRVNLDLTELEELTLRDEKNVAAEQVTRKQRDLEFELKRKKEDFEEISVINYAIELARRTLTLMDFRERLGQQVAERSDLEDALPEMLVIESVSTINEIRGHLLRTQKAPGLNYEYTMDLINVLQVSIARRLMLAQRKPKNMAKIKELIIRLDDLKEQFDKLPAKIKASDKAMAISAKNLAKNAELMARQADKLIGRKPLTPIERQRKIRDYANRVLKKSNQLIQNEDTGMTPIKLNMDEAMLTAVVQRFDLMNLRGALADQWRRIKLAGDDLKSILNLNATQIVRTDPDHNRPFNFTLQDMETRLSLSFDAPLNRKAQRNAFRLALINYNVALRNLMALEDSIKLAIRNDLRNLQLDREQYHIQVSSAALANERVLNITTQLRLGRPLSALEYVAAQQAYAGSLTQVANEHINYITDRIALFVDLETLQVNENGFWDDLYNERVQPEAIYWLPPMPYGTLPPHLWYSHKIKRMLTVPPGQSIIHGTESDDSANPDAPEYLPAPQSGRSVQPMPTATIGRIAPR